MSVSIDKAGAIKWSKLDLYNYGTQGLDQTKAFNLLGMINEVNLYEDIFSHTMHGNILIVDTLNVITQFPIIGMETLEVKFELPGMRVIEKVFKVIKVSDHHVEGNKQTYVLHFISPLSFADARYSLQRAYTGTAGNIIGQIVDEVEIWDAFYTNARDKLIPRDIDAQQTYTLKLVSPQWSPSECIRWCEKKALSPSTDKQADYLFYESNRALEFKSLKNLYSAAPKTEFIYDHVPAGNSLAKEYMKILRMSKDVVSDTLQNLISRLYGQTTYVYDTVRKKLTIQQVDYAKIKTITDLYIGANQKSTLKRTPNFNVSLNYATSVAVTNDLLHAPLNTDTYIDPDRLTVSTRDALLNITNLEVMRFDVWGRTDLAVGDMIRITLGEYTQHTPDTDDKKNSGNWLITAIHHRLALSQYQNTYEVARISTDEELLPA
jgi:hypothetical protein